MCGTLHAQSHHSPLGVQQPSQASGTDPSPDKALCGRGFLVSFSQEINLPAAIHSGAKLIHYPVPSVCTNFLRKLETAASANFSLILARPGQGMEWEVYMSDGDGLRALTPPGLVQYLSPRAEHSEEHQWWPGGINALCLSHSKG